MQEEDLVCLGVVEKMGMYGVCGSVFSRLAECRRGRVRRLTPKPVGRALKNEDRSGSAAAAAVGAGLRGRGRGSEICRIRV